MDGYTYIFYFWWLLVNAFSYYTEYTFFIRFAAGRKIKIENLLLYLCINGMFTFLVLSVPIPAFVSEVFHAGIMYLFMYCLFKGKQLDIITPAVIIYSVSTFLEGISAVFMRWFVKHITESMLGYVIQIAFSVIVVLLFYLILRYVESRHRGVAPRSVSPYLYVLLLPCTFVVWVVRFGFGLDDLSNSYFPFASLSLIWALMAILGAAATFFIILKVFENIIALSKQEMETALLNNQLEEQKIYLEKAKKRDEQLSSLQHDIDNHLAVLSGLLREERYNEAQTYFQKLQVSWSFGHHSIQTGNSVLDILLREKVDYAEQNHILVSCQVSLPCDLPIDDMDLCIIVSNALDNAIQACIELGQSQPDMEIVIKVRHQFLLVEVTNPTLAEAIPSPGTGLRNIQRTAKKYQGTMEVEQSQGRFRLSVLLCLNFGDTSPNTK